MGRVIEEGAIINFCAQGSKGGEGTLKIVIDKSGSLQGTSKRKKNRLNDVSNSTLQEGGV